MTPRRVTTGRGTAARGTAVRGAAVRGTAVRGTAGRGTAGRGTATSRFGVGRRENHDASEFYARFVAPELSDDESVKPPFEPDPALVCGDSRHMNLPDNSVALVVTSPPYFAGKAYEEALGTNGIPADYLEYLEMLRDVFAECKRVLEPGGRMAVNVANLGRKPYRSLSADVTRILQDDLGLLLRGEVIWVKAEGASGSCAWGSFRSAANPVLRDVTERVVVASKGRFDRALPAERRREMGLPAESWISNDEFMEATLDLWRIPPESARRVGHPAPFPVELPLRIIDLYTYRGDLVLDPFLGSGTTAVAAARRGRRWAGYDTDPEYVAIARRRVEAELAARRDAGPSDDAGLVAATAAGRPAHALAEELVAAAGFRVTGRRRRIPGSGTDVAIEADDARGECWYFDVTGSYTVVRAGLSRPDVMWRALGRAGALTAAGARPLVLLTSHLPPRRSAGEQALRAVGPKVVFDAMEITSAEGRDRLARYAAGGRRSRPLPGFWPAG